MIGQTISHYRILEKLGEGGMGVVYKAHDLKLDRDVALKFLPERFSATEEDSARFLQEARAASALSHPNVCHINAIVEHEGRQFIDMELVDGDTLRTKIPVHKLSDALGFAIQIGEALSEAHAKGIVHRDIKADNIMVNAKNQIKVMDFGLAKLKGTLKLTRTSSTVGTLAYMAPEQLQGGAVDARSDIFSFGVVVFEMLTGKTPFRGEHEAAMMYSILNEEPEPLPRYLPDASPELLHILGRALEKTPEDRYQNVSEMVIDLRRLQKQSSKVSRVIPVPPQSSPPPERGAPVSSPTPAPGRRRTRLLAYAGGALLLLCIGLYVGFPGLFRRAATESGQPAALNPNMTLRVLQIPMPQVSYPGISADGNWISFPAADRTGSWDIYYMHSSRNDPKRITNDSLAYNEQESDISPDGSQVVYTPGNGEARLVSALGGLSRKVADNVGLTRWRPDAARIGFERVPQAPDTHYELWSAKPDGSDLRRDYRDTLGTNGRFSFSWSPDGNSVAWIRSFEGGYQEVINHNLETGKDLQLTFDRKNVDDVCWLHNGMILYSSNKSGNTNLWVVPANGGTAQQVTKGGGPDIGITASADMKKIVYLQQQSVGYVWIADVRTSRAQQMTFDDRDITEARLSPDGKRLALIMTDQDPLKAWRQVYVQDRDGNNRLQLTNDEQTNKFRLAWSPDGKSIAYSSLNFGEPADSTKIVIVDAGHPGSSRIAGDGFMVNWQSNGSLLTLRLNPPRNEMLSLETGKREQLYLDSTLAVPVASGTMLLYTDTRRGKEGSWVVPADYQQKPSHRTPKLIEEEGNMLITVTGPEFFYYQDKQRAWWKYEYRSGKHERTNLSVSGIDQRSFIRLSDNGEELVYVNRKQVGRLVMIENLFQ